ncbi:MAG: zf-HC2 domain-containing protein [Bryobacterales bacterium]|nr:zf-HC2 domain-containing protein [Bryobacterales bacterium]
MDTKSHVRDEILEAYVLNRLQAEEIDQLEDHLLICEYCQKRLDQSSQFIQATRIAATRIRAQEANQARRQPWWSVATVRRPAFAVMTVAILAIALSISFQRSAKPVYQEVALMTTRGTGEKVAGRSGLRLKLSLGLQGVDQQPEYRVAVVDTSGKLIWQSGPVRPETRDEVKVTLDQEIGSGSYWVRLMSSSSGGSTLREYPLNVR